ncbi:MAG: sugar phosphate isomerase/epimerase family protein [Chloroflexota bacterium]|nr:sugar phosphate isomerase/epimerase family protein [Chloroflexota bacterium]
MDTKIPLGVCTWTFGDQPLGEIAQRVAALGLDGVELMGDVARYQASEAAQVLGDHGLTAFSLTPENVDLAHPDAATRGKAIDYYLRLLDFAAEMGGPIVSCHGYVGRVRAISTMAEERALFVSAVRQIAQRAQALDLRLVVEVLNRYEAHLVNTAAEALGFVAEVGADNIGILLDAYHMNIEEPNPSAALRQAGERLWLYHAADSNRQGIGRGHTDFAAQMAALAAIGYAGPIILECTAPGPDPFKAIKGEDSLAWLETCLQESRDWLRAYSERGNDE